MTASATPAQISALFGDVFEVLVKRGVIGCLLDRGVAERTHPEFQPWDEIRYSLLGDHLLREIGVVDPTYERLVREYVDHMAVTAFGLGWTTVRKYLDGFNGGRNSGFVLDALWCPLSLKRRVTRAGEIENRADLLARFWTAMRLPGEPEGSATRKGNPAMSDFLLVGRDKRGERCRILCLEFSLNAPSDVSDFTFETTHLDELARHVSLLERRGVFSRVSAEVSLDGFVLSRGVTNHLGAFTSRDKPLYKLCQASSYVVTVEHLLRSHGRLAGPVDLQVVAVTGGGVEGFSAAVDEADRDNPQFGMLQSLGAAYRSALLPASDDPGAYIQEISIVYDRLRRVLPKGLQSGFHKILDQARKGLSGGGRALEHVTGFLNPNHPIPEETYSPWLPNDPAIDQYWEGNAREVLRNRIAELTEGEKPATLRVLHEAAVSSAIDRAPTGRMTVLGLEGHPGIGKTTAVVRTLGAATGGFVFVYLSPRVVINSDVSDKVARRDGRPTGTLALTTNSTLIRGGPAYYNDLVQDGQASPRKIRAAVLADGLDDLKHAPDSDIWTVDQETARRIDIEYGASGTRKKYLDDRRAIIQDAPRPGVLRTLARQARELAQSNPMVNRVVLTAAVQGFREVEAGKTTVQGLSELFQSAPDSPRGPHERQRFGGRFRTVVVMVDELAGDGAGSPLVHALADWLYREFLDPFSNHPDGSPFKVILILADASLGNEVVLEKHLANPESPDKVLISKGAPDRPFRIALSQMKLGSMVQTVLHVMADAFPAKTLAVEYAFRLNAIDVADLVAEGKPPKSALRNHARDAMLGWVVEEILRALEREEPQIIFFAQDKAFLGEVRTELLEATPEKITVEILDGSVHPNIRKRLVSPEVRDGVRVFLMTSSGARGVSFPRTTTIIAHVPSFSIEAGLMEIAQLVYRGRGTYLDPATGEERSGDHENRQIVFMMQDFLLEDGTRDPRQWVRHMVDLVTLLALLRSTLFTRIKGDSELHGRSLAVVPVGRTGTDEMVETMSDGLRSFLREAKTYIYRERNEDLKGPVGEAALRVATIFGQVKIEGRFSEEPKSFVRHEFLADLCAKLSSPAKTLLRGVFDVRLPDTVFCVGSVWLEDWSEVRITESYLFEIWDKTIEAKRSELLKLLFFIKANSSFPPALRRPAEVLCKILVRDRESSDREYTTSKEIKTTRAWLALPADYPRFLPTAVSEDEAKVGVSEPDAWLGLLNRMVEALRKPTTTLPIIPKFERQPYLMLITYGDPTDLDRAFDNRTFMVSSELNLLNAVLFAEEDQIRE